MILFCLLVTISVVCLCVCLIRTGDGHHNQGIASVKFAGLIWWRLPLDLMLIAWQPVNRLSQTWTTKFLLGWLLVGFLTFHYYKFRKW